MKVSDVCRQYGISSATYYNWKSKYGGMDASEMKRMRELQEENWRKTDAAVINTINEVLKKSPQARFWKCYGCLRFKGHPFNHKRVYRVYCRMGL